MGVGAGHHHGARLHGLPQGVQHPAGELRQLVEKQHAEMGEGDLSRPGAGAAPHHGRHGGGMVRIAKGPPPGEPVFVEMSRDRGDHADGERFLRLQRRQDSRQAGRQHGLPRARGADHQQVVGTGGGDLERAFRRLLPLHIGEIRIAGPLAESGTGRRRLELGSPEMVEKRQQVRRRQHLAAARPHGLRPVRRGGRSGRAPWRWPRWPPAERPPPESACRRARARRGPHSSRAHPPARPPWRRAHRGQWGGRNGCPPSPYRPARGSL